MNVSACLVTRGDVDMQPVIDSLPPEWEKVVWDNSGQITINGKRLWGVTAGDLAVYGRYAAIAYAKNALIFTQDDDCIVSDPQAIVDALLNYCKENCESDSVNCWPARVSCNMPERFRHDFYSDHSLVGFGAAFHRDAPKRAFEGFLSHYTGYLLGNSLGHFNRCCDIVFTGLTPCVRVDVLHEDREMASDPNRMWKQPQHVAERTRMLELVRAVK